MRLRPNRTRRGLRLRRFALALSLGSLVLASAALVRAQSPAGEPVRELAIVGTTLVAVDDVWSSGARGRSARVTAHTEGRELVLHDGPTVRMATAGRDDALAVVLFHGGDDPFARVLVSRLEADHLAPPVTVELDRSVARGRSDRLRPAVAVTAATADGFVVVLEEQEPDPTAAVVTTLTRLDAHGVIVEATHPVAVPWQLAAIAANGDGYELVVTYGGGGTPDAPTARACVVHLGSNGEPTEHPWWASTDDAMAEIHVVLLGTTIVVGWRSEDGVTVRETRWPSRGAWGHAPTAIATLGRVAPDEAYTIAVRDGAPVVVTH